MANKMAVHEGEILRKYLRDNKITQTELAETLGMTRGSIVQYCASPEIGRIFKDKLTEAGYNIFDSSKLNEPVVIYEAAQANGVAPGKQIIMNVRLVNQYAHAGYMRGYADPEYMGELPLHPWLADKEYKGNYISFEVKGDSMDDGSGDSYLNGDILLCREISRDHWHNKLHFNKWAFVVVHKREGILVKRIVAHDTQQHTITLHSLNTVYKDFTVTLDDVAQLFNVVKFERSK